MWTSSQTIRPGALGAFLAALGALAQPAAAAEEKAAREEVRIAYSIHLGGFEVGEVAMDALVGPASYEARSTLETRGLADALFKSHYDTQAQGAIVEGVVAPATYGSDFRGAGSKTQKVRMSWQAGRPRLDLAEPSYDKARAKRPVSEELQRATVDPLSAMLFVILGSSASADAPCGATVPIYDGKRRYNLNFRLEEESEDGASLGCAMEYQRVAGFKTKNRDDDEFPVPPLRIAMSRAHHARMLVPERIEADTPIGVATLVLTRFSASPAGARTADVAPGP